MLGVEPDSRGHQHAREQRGVTGGAGRRHARCAAVYPREARGAARRRAARRGGASQDLPGGVWRCGGVVARGGRGAGVRGESAGRPCRGGVRVGGEGERVCHGGAHPVCVERGGHVRCADGGDVRGVRRRVPPRDVHVPPLAARPQAQFLRVQHPFAPALLLLQHHQRLDHPPEQNLVDPPLPPPAAPQHAPPPAPLRPAPARPPRHAVCADVRVRRAEQGGHVAVFSVVPVSAAVLPPFVAVCAPPGGRGGGGGGVGWGAGGVVGGGVGAGV